MNGDDGRGTMRSLMMTVYLPTFIFATGQGAVIPIVALAARDIGASVAVAGIAVALRGIGTLAFDVPAGMMVARLGERRSVFIATAMLVISLIGCIVSTTPLLFAMFMFLMGCAWSVWLLARLTYVTDEVAPHLRGRALSTLGGVNRVGNFVGPFIGAVVVTAWGLDAAYGVHILLAFVGCGVLFLWPDTPPTAAHEHASPMRVRQVAREHRHTFMTAGVVAMMVGVFRTCRQLILPLWADAIGLDAAQVSIIFGCSAALDMTLFYPAGIISDRWGRKMVAVPCLVFMAAGMVLVPLSQGFASLLVVGLILGFGNGLGSGIVMTLGSDFAPRIGRAEFLGVWRLVGDVGIAGGPVVFAAIEAASTLAVASIAVGTGGLAAGLAGLARVAEPLHRIGGAPAAPLSANGTESR